MIRGKHFFLFRLIRSYDDSAPLYVVAESLEDLKARIGSSYFEQFIDVSPIFEVEPDFVRAIFQFVVSEFC